MKTIADPSQKEKISVTSNVIAAIESVQFFQAHP
jgi:hypothetical protein